MDPTSLGLGLCDPHPEALADGLRRVARDLAVITPEGVLNAVIADPARRARALAAVVAVDHAGFMAPTADLAVLREAARAAGFDQQPRTFASVVVACELGVATTVFKASGVTPAGRAIAVELFVPSAPVRDAGIAHLALRVQRPDDVAHLARLLADEGFAAPPPLRDAGVAHAGDGLSLLYLDRPASPARPRLRLELCCRE